MTNLSYNKPLLILSHWTDEWLGHSQLAMLKDRTLN